MAYTEFYCQNGGSNLNAGSTTNNTATYTSIHGNWVSATGVFTPTDATTPASTVSVGMWASIYIDGASVGVYIGRISAVAAGVNGAITANTTGIGVKPADQTGTATIKVEGAWQGPNAASGFPLTLSTWASNQDATSHVVRLNLKNDQTYTMTASFAVSSVGSKLYVVQGYTSSVGDGGRATFDGTTNAGTIVSDVGITDASWQDIIFKTAVTTGSANLVTATRSSSWFRCSFSGARNNGLSVPSSSTVVECEAYDNNKAAGVNVGGFLATGVPVSFKRCISHDNTGASGAGFIIPGGPAYLDQCISDTNGRYGIVMTGTGSSTITITNCDIYANVSDGINIVTSNQNTFWIENTNFIKNGGAGINNVSVINSGYVYNCGYGAGTQANTNADTLNNLATTGAVTYASNVTPWVDPANGNFSIILAAAESSGRGAFTETAPGYSGTVGYPDIGAAQSLQSNTGIAGLFTI